ncbi:MAG: DinB family protein [Bryobacterales bacterium]|nr:DinB family protein [Acidobacteriota bacterium]MCB9384205.1 DinB family protein [Bryobacterales bacterium]
MSAPQPEPWLRGPLPGLDPLLQPVFHSFEQVREDLAHHTHGLTAEQVWAPHGPLSSIGFQLRHIAGSVDRLTSYLVGDQLSAEQIAALKQEGDNTGASLEELLAEVDAALAASEARMRTLDTADLYAARHIGRKQLPSTVLGLLVHLAEHTQRHLGQVITTAKLVR